MNYKIILYVVFTFLSAYCISGINFTNFFKKNKIIESRIFIFIISISLGYLVTNFVYEFVTISSIIK